MWRAFLLAIGVTLVMLGIECSLLDHFHLRPPTPESSATAPASIAGPAVTPPGWAGILLLLGGLVMVLGSWRVSSRKKMCDKDATMDESLDQGTIEPLPTLIAARTESDPPAESFFDFDEDDFFDEDE